MKNYSYILLLVIGVLSCKSETKEALVEPIPVNFNGIKVQIDNQSGVLTYTNVGINPIIKVSFGATINMASAKSAIIFNDGATDVDFQLSTENKDSILVIKPTKPLGSLIKYYLNMDEKLESKNGGKLKNAVRINFTTQLDLTDKFPRISDEELLTLVQKQTFKYFWDFAHPVSGLARERNTSGDVVTSGGSGFGIMTIPVAIERKFITHAEGLARIQKVVSFLKNNTETFHGAFPHWLHGATGKAVPFSTKDNGADLVETSFLMQGLLTVRQYFNGQNDAEIALRNDINALWNAVEWDWFRKNNENILYWHWSPNYNWDINLPIKGWNECLITYVLAASSTTHPIDKTVYQNGFAGNGNMQNGQSYFGIKLPLGNPNGGPLFFSQYSFLGLDPTALQDQYANYFEQNKNHTLINRQYCIENPKKYAGYSADSWGLTASDIPNGYNANSPSSDRGVITPTAAISSMPYTASESMTALRFFYYQLGDKIWGEYGFKDAFSLQDQWFADSYLAIDQGPIIIMIENHRSQLLWNLFMSCPEVKKGLKKLEFSSKHL